MSLFTPFYGKVPVLKGKGNTDPGNQTGDTLDVYEDMNNVKPGQYRRFYVLFKFVELVCGSCNAQVKQKATPSTRWFVYANFSQNTYHSSFDGMTTLYNLYLWDNHGQKYNYSYNAKTANPDPTLTIHENDKQYPDPLPDIMIDLIKYNPFSSQTPIEAFQTKLQHLYLPQESVQKDLQELEELRKEVAELRKHSNSQQKEILSLHKGIEVLEDAHDKNLEELKEQKSLTKVLRSSLEALLDMDKNRIIEKEEVIDPVALPEPTTSPTQNNPFDTI